MTDNRARPSSPLAADPLAAVPAAGRRGPPRTHPTHRTRHLGSFRGASRHLAVRYIGIFTYGALELR